MTDKTDQPGPADEKPDEPDLPPVPVFTSSTVPQNPPPHMVVSDSFAEAVFVAQTELGEFRTSLRVSDKLIRQLEDLTQREQFDLLLNARGEKKLLEHLGELDSIEAVVLRSKFFQAHYERQQARLGEFFGSSDS